MSQTTRKRFFSEDEHTVNDVRNRFLKVNKGRLDTVQNALKPRQRIFLELLPLLLHYNEATLPGFIGDDCPIGIYDFAPGKEHAEAAKSLVKSYRDKRSPLRSYNIYALYLIGSAGTIAYTDRSDLDIWVCHRPDMSDSDIDLLQTKCDHLREWAQTLELEANFFILTPESIREGRIESMSDESSGSAQHLLLIEEFYRSGLLLAGRVPAWWLVPPDKENQYYQHLEMLLNKKIISEHDIIDFGDVTTIPPAEYYGAALWQLNKAIESPYKSILKLLLMETYASEFPETDLLCTRLKSAIYDGETNIDKLDSYVLMIDKLEEYLSSQHSTERLHLSRKCFYFKVHEWLTNVPYNKRSRSQSIMSELVEQWQWHRDDLLLLDARENWKIDRVLEERTILVNELTNSYRMLTDMARQYTHETNINQDDLNVLGRRLYSAFERKPGKVELINPGISIDLSEKRLTFVYTQFNGAGSWLLFRSDYESAKAQKLAPIKRSNNLIELVAWCHFNGLIGNETMISLHSTAACISSQELLKLIDSFKEHFPNGYIEKSTVMQLSRPACITKSVIFINIGIDPMATHTRRGLQLTSNRSDALSFGGKWQNLVQSCSTVVITSWGEVLTHQYEGSFSLLDCLTEHMAWTPVSSGLIPNMPAVQCFAASYGNSVSRRITQLYRDLTQYFYNNKSAHTARYILRIERNYTMLQLENDVPRYERITNDHELVAVLGRPLSEFSPYMFDRFSSDGNILQILQRFNRPNSIQLFYLDKEGSADIYVLDEMGSLYFQTIEYFDIATMLGHYQHFFDAAIKRRNMQVNVDLDPDKSLQYEFYPIRKSLKGFHVDIKEKIEISQQQHYFNLQVIGDVSKIEKDAFYLYCNGTEFSNLEYGNNVLQEAVGFILSTRKSGEKYPIYITDIDINHASPHKAPVQTTQLLNYKKHIEQQLNMTLKKL